MLALRALSAKLIADESGTESLEYSLILGFIVVVVIAAIVFVGTKVTGRWTTINDSGV